MRASQEEIYYLHDASRTMAESSPYFEAFRKKGIEVIFLYSLTDEVSVSGTVAFCCCASLIRATGCVPKHYRLSRQARHLH